MIQSNKYTQNVLLNVDKKKNKNESLNMNQVINQC